MERKTRKWTGLASALAVAVVGAVFGGTRSPDAAKAAGAATKRTAEAVLTSMPFAIVVVSLSAVVIVAIIAWTHLAERRAELEANANVYQQEELAVRDPSGNVAVAVGTTRVSRTPLPEHRILMSIGQGPSPPPSASLDAQAAGKSPARTAKRRRSRGRHRR